MIISYSQRFIWSDDYHCEEKIWKSPKIMTMIANQQPWRTKQKTWWCWWGIWGRWLHNYGQGEHLPAHTLQLKTCRTATMIHPPMFSICGDFYTLYKNQSTLPMQLIQAYAKRKRLCRLKCNSCNTSDTIVQWQSFNIVLHWCAAAPKRAETDTKISLQQQRFIISDIII